MTYKTSARPKLNSVYSTASLPWQLNYYENGGVAIHHMAEHFKSYLFIPTINKQKMYQEVILIRQIDMFLLFVIWSITGYI